jgi:LCP family protein required for cell wall assembly
MMTQRAISRYQTESKRRRIRAVLIGLAALVLLVGGVEFAYVTHIWDTGTTLLNTVFQTPVSQRPAGFGPSGEEGTPVTIEYPDWSKKEPFNILLIGLDYRPGEEDSRADTQIIVHIDPAQKSAAMVAIPRDLWVPIPHYGEGRINSAFQHGESDPETDGPSLAMWTIEDNFGIPLRYYAQVDFTGFEKIIDTMGGLTIDVPKPLVDNDYPLGNYGVTRIYIPAGLQHMDGRTALAYARSRHADSDLGRNSRQQQVLLALRQQGINLNLITKLDQIAANLKDSVKTNLTLQEIGSLAQLSRELDPASIQTVQIDANMVTEIITSGGADVLQPNWALIRPKIAQAFADPKLAKEGARLSVQNGTAVGGMAKKLQDTLVEKGYYVADLRSVDAAEVGTYPKTVIIDYSGGGKPATIDALTKELGIPASAVQKGAADEAPIANADGKPVDIAVIVGEDRVK